MKEQLISQINAIKDPFEKHRAIDNFGYSLAGPGRNKDRRQAILKELTGKDYPKAKAGIHEIMKVLTELTTEKP